MTDPRILIAYTSKDGQTAKIANAVATRLSEGGASTRVRRAGWFGPQIRATDTDAIVIGGSVRFGRHARRLRRFVIHNLPTLRSVPAAFFSVSGAAAGSTPEARAEAGRYLERFLARTGWRPPIAETFAGAIRYTRYNPILRRVMRRISAEGGPGTDTTRDYEYTDWARVQAFAERVLDAVRGSGDATAGDAAEDTTPREGAAAAVAGGESEPAGGGR